MSFSGIGEVSSLIGKAIDKIWPDKSEQERQELANAMLLIQGQLEINKAEAANPSVFVSGWRPAIGWVCGAACAWNWVGLPIVELALGIFSVDLDLKPADLTEMMPVLIGMLGLGGFRSLEKIKGVARN